MRVLLAPLFLAILWSCSLPPGFTQTQADLFNDATLNDVRITMNPADWQTLKQNYLANTYYPANWQWRNITLEDIAIRSRGKGSRSPIKPGLRVDFDRNEPAQTFLGLKSVIMRNNTQDPSMMHEAIAFNLFRRMGQVASREAFVRFFVNNEYIGVYTVVESVDKPFLNRTLNDSEGYLYKYEYATGAAPYYYTYMGSDPNLYCPLPFEPETHEDRPNCASLEALVRTMNDSSGSGFEAALAPYLNIRQFLDFVAIEQFLAEEDGVLGVFGTNNFYLYRLASSNLHRYIAWDKSNAFRGLDRDILLNASQFVPMKKILEVPELKTYFLQRVLATAQSAAEGGWMRQQIDTFYNLIQQAAYADPNKQCQGADGLPRPCTNAEFDAEVSFLRLFADNRLSRIQTQVAANGLRSEPRLSNGGAVDAADSQGTLAPGALVSIYGQGLSAATAGAASLPLPTEVAGASMTVNGVLAPILFASSGQVNIQIPWETQLGTATIAARFQGVTGNSITATVGQYAPGIFVTVYPDGSLTTGRPAAAGDILVIYANGLGPVNPAVVTGAASPGTPARTTQTPTVTFGGVNAEVQFSGLTPGLAGLYQVNVRVPAGIVVGGNTPVVLSIGGRSSAPKPVATR